MAGRFGLVERLLASTGSTIPAAQRACYRRLFSDPAHVRGAMGFMAAADLPALLPACAALPCPAAFVIGRQDHWVPGAALRAVLARYFAGAEIEDWPGGHLLHEVDPARATARVLEALARCGPSPSAADKTSP